MSTMGRLAPLLFGIILTAAAPLTGQLVLGQYENEAPLRSWNSFPLVTASSLGRGETALASAADGSAALSNPALLLRLPRFTVTVNGYFTQATILRYSYVNTGVVTTTGPIGRAIGGADLAAVSFRWGEWAVAVTAASLESYARPSISTRYTPEGQLVYADSLEQAGSLRGLAFSLARRFGSRLGLGLTVISLSGDLSRTSYEDMAVSGYTISDNINQTFSGLSLQGGIYWEPWNGFTLAAIIRGPFDKKADNRSLLRYQAPAGNTDIQITDSARDSLRQPWIAGLGLAWRAWDWLNLNADAVFYEWSRYALEYFGEAQTRGFRDTVRLGLGAEFLSQIRLFGRLIGNPNRIGFVYDPQPMADPRSAYFYFTFGTGLHWKTVHLDLAGSIGAESGSGQGLAARRIALTFSYLAGERP
jgi:hypothetical protein